jgi:hypothetical protein
MEIYKITKSEEKTILRGLSQKQAYQLEKEILLLLEKNFKCVCGQNTYHFPKIVSSLDTKYRLKLTNCGHSLDKIREKIKISNKNEQIKCIVTNLKKSNIQHLDMVLSGKNICLNTNGILSVIDFDIASIKEDFLSTELKDRFEIFTNQKTKEWFYETGNLKLAPQFTNKKITDYYSVLTETLQKILHNF